MVTAAQIPGWLRALYPFEPRSLALGRVRLSYVDEGPRSAEAVILLHGNPTWSFFYRELIRRLSAAGIRAVAPDHIGMGLSDKPSGYPYRLERRIADVAALIEHLGLAKVHLVVHDWGGAVGFGWAVHRPDLAGRIAVLNTAAFPSRWMPWRIAACRAPLLGEWLMRGANAFAGPATWMAVRRRPLPADIKRAYLFPYDSWGNRIGVARFVQDIPMGPAHPSMAVLEEIGNSLPKLADHPMLITWGGADFCFDRRFFEEWRRRFPNAQARLIPNAGHYLMEDAPDETIPEIEGFLKAEAGLRQGPAKPGAPSRRPPQADL